jgi:hypothetical protein
MFAFSRANQRMGTRIADLEMEARMRRVRVLLDLDQRTDALKEIKRVKTLLEARKGEPTPTVKYVRGITGLAVGGAAWPLRTLLALAGIDGDADRGRAVLLEVTRGSTVYRFDALYLMHYFAEESPGGTNGSPLQYSGPLSDLFPSNPQLAYDYAGDLLREKRAK